MSSHERFTRPIHRYEIRLLTCHSLAGKAEYSLDIVSKEDSKGMYVAISYAWGDQEPISEITLRTGATIALSRTLTALFEALRSDDGFTIWVDALCIDQARSVEKSAQVSSMDDVYRNASQVLIWLGPGTAQTYSAMRYLQSKRDLTWPEGWEDDIEQLGLGDLGSVYHLLESSWFRRLWVMQEVVLGSDVVVQCGSHGPLSFSVLRECVFVLWAYTGDSVMSDYDSLAQRGLRCLTRLITIFDQYHEDGQVPYELLLQAGRGCETTDRRDRIFAIQGIAKQNHAVPLPNYWVALNDELRYTAELLDLYQRTAFALLKAHCLDCLALAGLAGRSTELLLPSWVPNLIYREDASEPLTVCNRGAWSLAEGIAGLAPMITELGLRLFGYRHDEVLECCMPFDFNEPSNLQISLKQVLMMESSSILARAQQSTTEFWKRQIKRGLIFGLDAYDQPVAIIRDRLPDGQLVERYELQFEQWLDMLLSNNCARLNENVYHQTAFTRVADWKACLTQRGYLCLAPPEVEPGDRIYILPECRFPLILRHQGKTSDHLYSLVSWCYVEGWMQGQQCHLLHSLQQIVLS